MSKICPQCGITIKNGKLCCSCQRYFKAGGQIYDLPMHGTVQYTDDDKVVCHICGMAFAKLAEHVRLKHKLSDREYREEFGLEYHTRLVSNAYHQKMQEHALKNKTYPENFKDTWSGEKRCPASRLGQKQSQQEIESRREEQRIKGRLSKTKMTDQRKTEMGKIWKKSLPQNKKK